MWCQIWSSLMQSSPNGTVKKIKSLDQGSNDINDLLYFKRLYDPCDHIYGKQRFEEGYLECPQTFYLWKGDNQKYLLYKGHNKNVPLLSFHSEHFTVHFSDSVQLIDYYIIFQVGYADADAEWASDLIMNLVVEQLQLHRVC